MRKFLFVLTVAVLAASCTYSSDSPSMRTQANLAYLNNQIVNGTITAAVMVLYGADSKNLDYILSSSFDTLVTANAIKESFGLASVDMSITSSADSTWTVISSGTGTISFMGNIYMTGRNSSDKSPFFSSDFNGVYDEGNGFNAEFASPLFKFYWTYVPTFYEGYGYYNQFTLMREGDCYITTYNGIDKLDDIKVSYNGSDVKY